VRSDRSRRPARDMRPPALLTIDSSYSSFSSGATELLLLAVSRNDIQYNDYDDQKTTRLASVVALRREKRPSIGKQPF